MPRKVICLITFDYELSLGRNFLPPEKVLFEPTRQVLELCAKHSCPTTFFPDVCSVWAHRKYGLNEYADLFESQMKDTLLAGHDVQLHLHPHWLASRFENKEWLISTDKMYLHELPFDNSPDSAGALVRRGINYLDDLLCPLKADYSCFAFRAAGSALQPRENEIIKMLLDSGIKMDVSVTKFLMLKLDTVKIDYTSIPGRSIWRMSPIRSSNRHIPKRLGGKDWFSLAARPIYQADARYNHLTRQASKSFRQYSYLNYAESSICCGQSLVYPLL